MPTHVDSATATPAQDTGTARRVARPGTGAIAGAAVVVACAAACSLPALLAGGAAVGVAASLAAALSGATGVALGALAVTAVLGGLVWFRRRRAHPPAAD